MYWLTGLQGVMASSLGPHMALLLRGFQPYTLRSSLDRASRPCDARSIGSLDRTARTRRGEDPIPEYRRKRDEGSGLYPPAADGGAPAPARTVPRQNTNGTVLTPHSPSYRG